MNSMFHRILQPSTLIASRSVTSSIRNICSTFSLRDKLTPPATTNDNTSDKGPQQLGKAEMTKLVSTNKVVVFMKGNPEAPRCGFSNAVVQILRMHGVPYDAHDVLQNDQLRQGIKEFSDWPTIPQVFINGEFVGGCDILLQMHQSGDLVKELQKVGIESSLLKAAEELAKPQETKK